METRPGPQSPKPLILEASRVNPLTHSPKNRDDDPKIEMVTQKMSKNTFPEVGLPGVENDPTPRDNILRTSRPSQLPYSETYICSRFLANCPSPPIYRCGAAL